MVEKFLAQTSFTSQEDFIQNLKINVPENFNFGYDVVDEWAAEQPDKPALLWTNDKGDHRQFTFAEMKKYTDQTASYFQSLGIGHEAIPATSYDISNYNGRPYAESGAHPCDLSDNQKRFLKEDYLRHVLITIIESPEVAARWNNNIQAYVEGLGHGIPANNSSDPRHSARSDAEFNAGGGGKISMGVVHFLRW